MPRLTEEIIDALLPGAEPPFLLPDGVREGAFADLIASVAAIRERHIMRWVTFFQAGVEQNWPGNSYAGFNYLTYGFVPIGDDGRDFFNSKHPYVFGAAIELERDAGGELQTFDRIDVAGQEIPVVINRRTIELHSSTITGIKGPGTVTCWAKSNKSKVVPGEGVLTANHVVELERINQSVSCSLPGTWHLADRGGCKIDAALVVNGHQGLPPGCAPLQIERLPKQGADVEFTGAQSKQPISAKITHSFVHPSLLTTRHPMRIFIDSYGLGGDSGALVELVKNRIGAGIYMGRNPLDDGQSYEGVAQALVQAAFQLNLSLYQ